MSVGLGGVAGTRSQELGTDNVTPALGSQKEMCKTRRLSTQGCGSSREAGRCPTAPPGGCAAREWCVGVAGLASADIICGTPVNLKGTDHTQAATSTCNIVHGPQPTWCQILSVLQYSSSGRSHNHFCFSSYRKHACRFVVKLQPTVQHLIQMPGLSLLRKTIHALSARAA